MNIRKTYWTVFVSLLLSLSLVLPYCCHADISELFSLQSEMSSHAAHGQQSDAPGCDCGHEFVKDFQKNKKTANSQTLLLSSAVAMSGRVAFPVSVDFLTIPYIQPGILSDTGPPIRLLNSVFLN